MLSLEQLCNPSVFLSLAELPSIRRSLHTILHTISPPLRMAELLRGRLRKWPPWSVSEWANIATLPSVPPQTGTLRKSQTLEARGEVSQ